MKELRALASRGRFREIKGRLADEDLATLSAAWKKLKPMEKAVLFKLMERGRAMELFDALPFAERYFLLEAFPLESIAPVLEDLPAKDRAMFHRLPSRCYEQMLQRLMTGAPSRNSRSGTAEKEHGLSAEARA